jgi:hypothetical protein
MMSCHPTDRAMVLCRGVAIAIVAAASPTSAHAQTTPAPALDTLLERVRAYVDEYANHLPATISTEQYRQRVGAGVRYRLRTLESEYGIIRLPGNTAWLGFREVLKVDGKPVTDSASRLETIFLKPSATAIAQGSRIAEESARFNIGPVTRTINDPAFVLELLDPRNAHRMKFTAGGEATVADTRARIITFQEVVTPTIIKNRLSDNQPVRGRAWVNPESGRILRVEVMTQAPRTAGNFIATIDVTFQDDPKLGFWVPVKMVESYQNAGNLVIVASGQAVYTNYRRFTVDTQEDLLPKP